MLVEAQKKEMVKILNRKACARYRQRNLEKRRAECSIYWEKMTQEERSEAYKKVNDKRREKLLDYYQSHKEEAFSRVRNRRSRKAGNGGTHTAADIRQLWFLQKGKCTWCLKALSGESPHVDHRMPIALGGSNDKSNLQLLHASCNKSKAAHHPIEHGLKYGLLAW